MRITLLATNQFTNDPRAIALRNGLAGVGHDVHVVASGDRPADAPDSSTYVPARRPVGGGVIGRAVRRVQPTGVRRSLLNRGLVDAARATNPDILYPTSAHALDAARAAAGDHAVIVRDPRWPHAGPRDLVEVAPHEPLAATPPPGPGLHVHVPGADLPSGVPPRHRHVGRHVVLAYRKTDSNPGRYVEGALRRAGVEVQLETDRIDTRSLPSRLDAIVFVEGPYPALEIVGPPVDVPVVFFAHHGEHHLPANVRLARRYRADHVLLAHSWHLAHRFPVPVTRFPFGVPLELFDSSTTWANRRYDVAMVGAHLRGGGPYKRRQELVARTEGALGADRCAFLENVTADEMARAYEEARIVLNEGGTRHFPITMRVFEAIAAGALLVTEPIPGLDLLLRKGEEYVGLQDPVEDHVRRLLADPDSPAIAAAGARAGRERHTYDRRVDELLEVIDNTPAGSRSNDARPAAGTFAAALYDDVEIQRILQHGADQLTNDVPDREVWDADQVALRPGSYEAVCVEADDVDDLREVLRAARRLVYIRGEARGLSRYLEEEQPQATVTAEGALRRVDLGADSYAIKPHEVVEE